MTSLTTLSAAQTTYDRMVNELETVYKEATWHNFKVLFPLFLEGLRKTTEASQHGIRPRFEPLTPRILRRSAKLLTSQPRRSFLVWSDILGMNCIEL
jgi:hypothetical protein